MRNVIRPVSFKTLFSVLALGAVSYGGMVAAAASDEALRLCADPDNLPFSSDKADKPGLYVEIGQAIARKLGRPLSTVWYRTNFGKRALRTTLLAGQCDFEVGFPADGDFMGPRVIFSQPILQAGYALVTKKSNPVTTLEGLKGLTVAVQFSSSPQNFLAKYDDIKTVTALSPEEAITAFMDGKADAAFVWGPTAGYMNKSAFGDTLSVSPVAGPAMQWPVAVVFAKKETALRDAVNGALGEIRQDIEDLKIEYGFPASSPITLGAVERPAGVILVADTDKPAETTPAAPAAAAPPSNNTEEGRELFNGTCAHCHGPNAEQGERKIDLRLLHHRYGDKMEEVFQTTVTNGRPSKGMPSWKEVFTQDQFNMIFSYLRTKQSE